MHLFHKKHELILTSGVKLMPFLRNINFVGKMDLMLCRCYVPIRNNSRITLKLTKYL